MTTETTGTTEKFIIILMIFCFDVVSFVSVVSVVSKKNFPSPTTRISCEKGSDLALTRKLADGTYIDVFPIRQFD